MLSYFIFPFGYNNNDNKKMTKKTALQTNRRKEKESNKIFEHML